MEEGEMASDRIEREIEIEAPIEVVWAVVTEPGHIAVWATDAVDLDVRPGGDGRMVFRDKTTQQEITVNMRVERVEPPRYFSFRWNHPDGAEPDATNAPLVEFTLEARGESTRLRLVESGIDSLERPDEDRTAYFDDHSGGWTAILDRLRDHARAVAG